MSKKKEVSAERDSGYISLHRRIRKHWLWNDPVKFQWWVDILMECNYTAQKVSIGYNVIDCQRGQSINSLLTWAKRWKSNKNTVSRFFKMLQSDGMIRIENVQKTTRITVCNYDTYNNVRDETGTKSGRNRDDVGTMQGRDSATNNKDNKDNKDNKGEQGAAPNSLPVYGSPSQHAHEPAFEDVHRVFIQNGGTLEMAEKFYDSHTSTGWMLRGSPIKKFSSLVPNWIKNWNENEGKSDKLLPAPINGKLQPSDFV